jgi:hypothetical protein
MKRSPFHNIYRVYEDKRNNNITFETREILEVHSMCKGVIHNCAFDKIYKNYIIIYAVEENMFYMYYNLEDVIGCKIGEHVDIGDVIGSSDKLKIKIYEKCICKPINNYYEYLEILNKNNDIIKKDGIYYNGG